MENCMFGTGKQQNFILNLKPTMMYVLQYYGIHMKLQKQHRVAGMESSNTGTESYVKYDQYDLEYIVYDM